MHMYLSFDRTSISFNNLRNLTKRKKKKKKVIIKIISIQILLKRQYITLNILIKDRKPLIKISNLIYYKVTYSLIDITNDTKTADREAMDFFF